MANDKTTIEVTKRVATQIRKLHREHFPMMKSRDFVELMAAAFKALDEKMRRKLASEIISRQIAQALDKK